MKLCDNKLRLMMLSTHPSLYCYENRFSSVRPELVEGPFMVRQAHHERYLAHQFSFFVVLMATGMIGCEPFAFCHSEGAKRLKNLAQDRLRVVIPLSPPLLKGDLGGFEIALGLRPAP